MPYEYLYKYQTKDIKKEFIKKFEKIKKAIKPYFSIYITLVGSSKRNLILVNTDENHEPKENYDFDYQLVITNFKEKPSDLKSYAEENLKEYFREKFETEFKKESQKWKAHDSTTAITLNNKDENLKYSFDIVICCWINNKFQVIKRNTKNEYVWNELKHYDDHRTNLKKIKEQQLWNEVRKKYKSKKYEARKKQDLTPSYVLFIKTAKEVVDQNLN